MFFFLSFEKSFSLLPELMNMIIKKAQKQSKLLTQTGNQHDNSNQTIYLKMNAVPI